MNRHAFSAFVVWVAVVLATARVLAQDAAVTGNVTNSLTGAPVIGATVVLESPTLTRQVKTDPAGRFTIAIPPGMYDLIVRADTYKQSRRNLNVAISAPALEVSLDPELHYSEVVSVSPNARNQFDAYQPTAVLGGQELAKELQATLGATVENQPGIALRSFGPGPARPVIRGLDGDRVLVLEDGQRMGDLSSQSGDHGVNANPASASRIEVVRGPATLLYGANAIGGLVNVVTNEIPDTPVKTSSGSFTLDGGTAAREGGAAGEVTVGNGSIALHVSGSGRRADDFRSPEAEVPNSFNRSALAQVGLAYTSTRGFFGGSYAYDRSHYGIPFVEAGETNLDPRRQILNLRGERTSLGGAFQSIRGSFGVRRYRHDELDGEEIATSFTNNTTELEVLASHKPAGRLSGSVGGTVLTRAFKTEGEESLSPAVDQRGFAGFFYEELAVTPHFTLQFGARVERAAFEPAADEPSRDFTNVSGSVGILARPTEATSVAISLARAARNPALEELYFHGPHPGNFAFENGNPDLQSEHALGFDASFRWRHSRTSGEITYFLNEVDNFIFRELSGAIEDGLPESFFAQDNARLQGIESHIDLTLSPLWSVEAGLDYVRGNLTGTDQPLPRMPPLRGRAGLRFQRNAFQAGADGVFTARQDRIFVVTGDTGPVGETPTAGYNVLKVFTSYSFGSNSRVNTITVRLDNATNELYRNHLNYLKEFAPEVGRNLRVVYSLKF